MGKQLAQDMRRKLASISLLIAAAATCNGCIFGYYTPGTIATIGESTPCPSKQDVGGWQCVVEFPEFGYLGVNSQGYSGDETFITVRLAPHKEVEVEWFGGEIELVDVSKNITVQRQKVEAKPVVGSGPAHIKDNHLLLGYGKYIETRFDVKPLVSHMELRFPPVLVNGKQVAIPPIQLRERTRLPVVAPLFLVPK